MFSLSGGFVEGIVLVQSIEFRQVAVAVLIDVESGEIYPELTLFEVQGGDFDEEGRYCILPAVSPLSLSAFPFATIPNVEHLPT